MTPKVIQTLLGCVIKDDTENMGHGDVITRKEN